MRSINYKGSIVEYDWFVSKIDYSNFKTHVILGTDDTVVLEIDFDDPKSEDEIRLLLDSIEILDWRIYLVTTSDKGYDTYDGFVVITDAKRKVPEVISEKVMYHTITINDILEIGVPTDSNKKHQVILSSFNAG